MGNDVRSSRDLLFWQKGMDLAAEVYRLTRPWSKEASLRKPAKLRLSVPANIAEGYG